MSHAISELEAAVGEQLCVRRKARGMRLTQAGQYLAARARTILKETDGLVSELAGVGGELRGPVALGCYIGLASNVLPSVMEGFGKLHPGVDIGITVGDHGDLLPKLETRALDAAIVYGIGMPAGLQQKEIYKTEVMAVLAESHPLATQPEVDLAELAPEPLIMLESQPRTGYTRLMFDERGLTPTYSNETPKFGPHLSTTSPSTSPKSSFSYVTSSPLRASEFGDHDEKEDGSGLEDEAAAPPVGSPGASWSIYADRQSEVAVEAEDDAADSPGDVVELVEDWEPVEDPTAEGVPAVEELLASLPRDEGLLPEIAADAEKQKAKENSLKVGMDEAATAAAKKAAEAALKAAYPDEDFSVCAAPPAPPAPPAPRAAAPSTVEPAAPVTAPETAAYEPAATSPGTEAPVIRDIGSGIFDYEDELSRWADPDYKGIPA